VCYSWPAYSFTRGVGVFEVDTNTQSRSLVEPKEPAKQTPKTTAELAVLEQATMRAPLLGRLEPSHRTHLFNAMTSRTLEAGQVLYRQGDIADAMYVVQAGELAVAVERIQNSEEQELLYQYTALSCFGEQALISNHKRCSTVTAKSPCVLWVLDYNSFKTMIKLLMSFGG
jgi:CRP-like cAMP-binding protein